MSKYSSAIIGHITLDYNTDHLNNTRIMCGGAVLYSSAAAHAMGHHVCAVTSLAPSDIGYLDSFSLPREDIVCIQKDSTTIMRNHYLTADKERRDSVCSKKGVPFELEDLNVNADMYHFAGLVVGDFHPELIRELSQKGKIVVDVQAFLRNVDESTGKMYFADWREKKEYLPYIDILKTDAAEAEILTGTSDREEAARILHDWGAREVLITHNTEVIVYDGTLVYSVPIRARNLSGRTGRGDTTTAVYSNERFDSDIFHSLLTATACVSLKMETPGVYRGTRADVEQYIRTFYQDYL